MTDIDLREPLDAAAVEFARLVRELGALPAESLSKPTPCADYDTRGLLNHVLYWSPRLIVAARKESPLPEEGGREATNLVTGDWANRMAEQTGDIAAAFRDPAAWEGMTSLAGGRLPAGMLGQMAVCEFVLHGWDLATASGMPFQPSQEVADAALTVMRAIGEGGRKMGAFGPEVPVPETASSLERAIGLSGRDPAWTP